MPRRRLRLPAARQGDGVRRACKRLFAKRYPDINGPDFTSIIDQRCYDRLKAALEDARAKGATLINLAEGQSPTRPGASSPRNRAEPDPRMEIMRREIFGPILPVRLYDSREEVARRDQRWRPAARPLPVHQRSARGTLYSPRPCPAAFGQRGDPARRAARPAVRRGRRERHGALSRPRGLRDVLEVRPVFQQGPVSSVQLMMQPPHRRARPGGSWIS